MFDAMNGGPRRLVAAAGLAALALAPAASQERVAAPLRERYVALTRGWAREAAFTDGERRAMADGRQREDAMTSGLDDPLARAVLAGGEPSFEALAALYPGKVLDRTVLGSYTDPRHDAVDPGNEFVIWWNGAISADLVKGPAADPTQIRTLGENTNILFRVGPDAEMFGRDGERYSRIGYEDGYLPIVRAAYECDGVRYAETAFADRSASDAEVAYVRFELTNLSDVPRTAELHEDVLLLDGARLTAREDGVRDAAGALVLAFSGGEPSFEDARRRVTQRVRLAPGATAAVLLEIPYRPDPAPRATAPSEERFQRLHDRLRRASIGLLSSAMRVTVPEARVNAMWRALVLQNFVLADGPRFTYGSGLVYNESYYPFESGFAALTMARYGFADAAEAWLGYLIPASVERQKAGWRYQNRRAIPLHLLYEMYLLTGRAPTFAAHRDALIRVAEEIIADRHTTMTPAAGPRPWHWGLLPPARPAVDAIASTRETYVVAHDITNCQGLQDFGEFLISSGVDIPRGRRYLREAAAFRQALLRAMAASAIRIPGAAPFVPLDTLYFRETPGYGPEPYRNLALGRVQGTYYHYWADMELRYNFFNPGDALGDALADYPRQHGGFVLGLTRARPREGQPYGWINGNYNAGYYEHALAVGDVGRFLLGFYSRLAFAASRHVYVASEGSPLIGYNTHDGGFVAAEYALPNSAANAETLDMLRDMLVHEQRDRNVPTGVVDLARGAPRAWFGDGRRIEVRQAPTDFGALSFAIESRAGSITAEIDTPQRAPYRQIRVYLRHPQSAAIRRVRLNGAAYANFNAAEGYVALRPGVARATIQAFYR